MLTSLFIQNYAIIDRLELQPDKGLTTITGETGAGKSILLGALSLVLGKRADTSVLFNRAEKCIVEATVTLNNYALEHFFAQHELDYDDTTLLRREINPQGKSRAFINDTPVRLTVLRDLASQIIDLHQQHETLELGQQAFQRQVLDALAGHEKQMQAYRRAYRAYSADSKELKYLQEADRQAQQEADYLAFQLQEVKALELEDPKEQERLEEELDTLTHAEHIKQGLFAAQQALGGHEQSATEVLAQVQQALRPLTGYNQQIEQLYQRLDSAMAELQDIQREMEHVEESVTLDEEQIQTLQDRLNELYRLEKKHGVNTLAELMRLQAEWEASQQGMTDRSDRIADLERSLQQQEKQLLQTAQQLSKARQAAAKQLQDKVNALLPEVGLPKAQLQVAVEATGETPGPDGIDTIGFYFSANKGATPQPIVKVASGGELSRLMLVIKSLVAASTALPTLIFDEIDTGISGEVALKVGELLHQLADHHQVLVITHLPQIASQGHKHLFVYKEEQNGHTQTRLQALEGDNRVKAIAQMIGGERPSSSALESARELLRMS